MRERNVFDPNDFQGSDSERIAQAVAAAAARQGTVRITRRDDADGRAVWLIDEAILLPGNLTLIIDNCTIQLSDLARDNFIRSANCGIGISEVEPIGNLHILGVGNAVLLAYVLIDDPSSLWWCGALLALGFALYAIEYFFGTRDRPPGHERGDPSELRSAPEKGE